MSDISSSLKKQIAAMAFKDAPNAPSDYDPKMFETKQSPKRKRSSPPRTTLPPAFAKITSKGDGHCFYRSILKKINNDKNGDTLDEIAQIRQQTAEIIQSSPELLELIDSDTDELQDLLDGVRGIPSMKYSDPHNNPFFWADEIAIKAISKIYPITVVFETPISYRGVPHTHMSYPNDSNLTNPDTIYVLYNTKQKKIKGKTTFSGNHYDLLVTLDDPLDKGEGVVFIQSARTPKNLTIKKGKKTKRRKKGKKTKRRKKRSKKSRKNKRVKKTKRKQKR